MGRERFRYHFIITIMNRLYCITRPGRLSDREKTRYRQKEFSGTTINPVHIDPYK